MNGERGSRVDVLACSRAGQGHPLVFLHGLGASRQQADATIAAVDGVERITVDLPAHGASAASTVALTFDAFADAVVELLDHLELSAVALGGISMGAGVSAAVATRRPDLVSALVLVRPAWMAEPGRPHLDLVAALGEWAVTEGLDGARHRLEEDQRFQTMAEHEPSAATSLAGALDRLAETKRPDVLSAIVDSQPFTDLADLAAVDQPALVVATAHDRLHPAWIAGAIAGALPNATLTTAPPRYLEPTAHQNFLTRAISGFLATHNRYDHAPRSNT